MNNIQIQLREKTIPGTNIERDFVKRVITQDFGNGIKTDGNGDKIDGVLVYHQINGLLGGYAKTEIGMKRLISKMRKELAAL